MPIVGRRAATPRVLVLETGPRQVTIVPTGRTPAELSGFCRGVATLLALNGFIERAAEGIVSGFAQSVVVDFLPPAHLAVPIVDYVAMQIRTRYPDVGDVHAVDASRERS